MVRPIIEYAAPVWSPRYRLNIERVEQLQMRATKLIEETKNMNYEQRLQYLELPTLVYRRLRGDLIEVYKMTSGFYDKAMNNVIPDTVASTQ